MDCVNSSALAEAVDAADPLFEPHRIPRELEVDDNPARVMEVQSFAACVCGEEHGLPAADEVGDRRRTLLAREPAVQQRRRPAERPLQMLERVAIFGEHDGGFADTAKQPDERGSLRLTPCRCARGGGDLLEQQTLARRIAQRQRGEVRRFISRFCLGIRIEKRQARLPRIMRCVLTQRVVAPAVVSLPVRKGQRLGRIEVSSGAHVLARIPLVAARTEGRPSRIGRVVSSSTPTGGPTSADPM